MRFFIFIYLLSFTACSSGRDLIKDKSFDEEFASEGIINGQYVLILKTFRRMELHEVNNFGGRFEEVERYRQYEKYNLEQLAVKYFFKNAQEDLREILKNNLSLGESIKFKKAMNNLGQVDLRQQVNCIDTNVSKSFKEYIYIRECRIKMEIPAENLLKIYSLNESQSIPENIKTQITSVSNYVRELRERDQIIIPPYRLSK